MYLALYRSYRPRTFRDVFSQEHITLTLQNQIRNNLSVHAYLFTGSRGTGKTSCARILAKALCCLAPDDGNPCLVCRACVMIDNGCQDISEIDAASNNGVDDVRMLRDETKYAPVSLKYRVYIIDEVHMLSQGAFNALLKVLEEPPAHVVFILATTETHKLPATIPSRCQRFEFRRVRLADCSRELIKIAQKEGARLDSAAAELIARLSDGGMRDALTLLETCISRDTDITGAVVRECAGVAGAAHIFGISEAALTGNFATAMKIVAALHEQSKDMGRLLVELIRHYRNLMLIKLIPGETDMVSWLPEEAEDYKKLAGEYDVQRVLKALTILEEATERLARKGDKRLVAELAVIELCSAEQSSRGHCGTTQTRENISVPASSDTPGPPKEEKAPWEETLALAEKIETGTPPVTPPPPPEPRNKLNSLMNTLKQKGIEVKQK